MGETPGRSLEHRVSDLFEGGGVPRSTAEVVEATGASRERVADTLAALADADRLQVKAVGEGTRVWWRPHDIEATADDPSTGLDAGDPQRLLTQHRRLARLATRIDVTDDLDEILRLITEEARELIGAHQAVTSRTVNQNWEQAINTVSLSDKYAEFRGYDTQTDGSGIYAVVCRTNEPMRLTQSELESHPAWNAFGDEADAHPPMEGWLAVPIVGPDDRNMGLIQLSDKYRGEFTAADEAILVQLANVAAAAIENARLYDDLRESERRYRTLFESMTEGYCVVEPAGDDPLDFRHVEANPAFERHAGLGDVTDRTVREVVPDDPGAWVTVYDEVVRDGEVVRFEQELENGDRVLECQAFPVGDAVGVTVQDVTERVERERRLKESNDRLEQFAYAASHDLQEPLRMVSSYLQLLESRYADDLDDEGLEFLAFAVDGAERMLAMIDALLEYSRVQTQGDPLEPVALDDVFADVRRDLEVKIDETNADLTVEPLPTVEGDPSQLRQVFQNLLDNAIEYSGEGPPQVSVSATRDGDEWEIAVADDGIGIDPEHAETVFQVFERLHTSEEHPGTGIGLALCERIVDRHGGDIRVDSEPGDGSTFRFTLPAVDGE